MNQMTRISGYGAVIEPNTLKIERRLPGPIDRIWAYITDGKLRQQWLAAGDLDLTPGAPFEFVWRNDELTSLPGHRPDGFPEEQRMQSQVVAVDAPHSLTIGWGTQSEVSFLLEPAGDDVLLTIIHRRLPDRENMLNVSAGWHMHLDVLIARLTGGETEPFWDGWARLKQDYDKRLPA